jgi:outer membrane lipoprotein-sorting protein
MRGMNRRPLLAALLAAPFLPALAARPARAAPPGPADAADLARIETYLNGIRTLKARFLQIAPDGNTSQGTAWLQRPGRMRFQYDPPSPLLLVAGHGLVVFRDTQLDQVTNIPLSSTPLGLLLREHITLSGDVRVSDVTRLPGQIQITLARADSPGDGSLTLIFSDNPLTLRQWTVTDAQGKETRVTLFNVELGGTFDQQLFNVATIPGNAVGPGGN